MKKIVFLLMLMPLFGAGQGFMTEQDLLDTLLSRFTRVDTANIQEGIVRAGLLDKTVTIVKRVDNVVAYNNIRYLVDTATGYAFYGNSEPGAPAPPPTFVDSVRWLIKNRIQNNVIESGEILFLDQFNRTAKIEAVRDISGSLVIQLFLIDYNASNQLQTTQITE